MPRAKTTTTKTRLNLELPARVKERLDTLRKLTEADSMVEVIRRALSVYHAIVTTRKDRTKVIIRNADGTERELVFA